MNLDGDLLGALAGLMGEDKDTFVPARLSILMYLYFTTTARFTKLQKTLGMTAGNLSSHLRKLEEMKLIRISKRFVDLKPTTLITITIDGTERVRSQVSRMRELVSAVMNKESPSSEQNT